ncbi:MAG: hypothetical protein JWM80_1837 [Cyanobacteria bacterium RYN_339]|nr:hypothetical protein [Cyanobacteria bacterium RYN_339]
MEKDKFRPSGEGATGPLASKLSLGTTPIPPASRAPEVGMEASKRRDELSAVITAHLDKLEERMTLLIRAGRMGNLPLTGIAVPFRFPPMSPNHKRLIDHLLGLLQRDPKLGQAIQVALTRYQQAARAVSWRGMTYGIPPTEEELRRYIYELSNLFAAFTGDRILATVFPPPERQAYDPHRMESAKERATAKTARHALVLRARRMVEQLAPSMAILEKALVDCDRGLIYAIGGLFSPVGRTVVILAGELAEDPAAVAQARDAHGRFQRLRGLLPQATQPEFDFDQLRDLLLPLGELLMTLRKPPALRALFAAAE